MSQVFLSGAWNEFSPGRMLSICFKAVAVSRRARETLSRSVGAGTRDQTTKTLSTFQCGVSGISVYQTSGARKVRGLRCARCRPGGALTTASPISSPPSASSHRRRCALAPAREPRSAGSKRSRRAGVSVSGANFRRCEVAGRLGAMSGDGSGRRSEGRGRGRDPHRDRTCSRSRSRSPLSPVSRRGAAPERREAPERPSLEETEPSDSGDEMMDPASLEAETDHGLCRQIRHQYRALINSVQRKAGRRGRGHGAARAAAGASPAPPGRASIGLRGASISVVRIALHDLGRGAQVPEEQDGTAGGQARAGALASPDGREGGETARGAWAPSLASSGSQRALARPRQRRP